MTSPDLRTVVGDNIRAAREVHRLSQRALADRLGIHWTNMNRIEQGRSSMNLHRLEQVSRVLSVTVADLVTARAPQ
ncbi:helix-turn-helix domain-containing protein [Aminobacter aminovorans]|uniref:Ribosome-binding protein aMBF1 (Putative translation factor) n=1 Tax=Aminobacter aminovorans TaxID=83263 RepID=A0AAC8YMR1_AMIAI|nr:helix-turn-helix transcriptional regulator [Aminobacter aminovorans]AMS41197.1 hypothetical protein AA2016_2269 [Aminobacter aminovorans]MBB3705820.1 ribosome-binding protein aMBF1 (putative translation factor) [Aminobacter aminovorans]